MINYQRSPYHLTSPYRYSDMDARRSVQNVPNSRNSQRIKQIAKSIWLNTEWASVLRHRSGDDCRPASERAIFDFTRYPAHNSCTRGSGILWIYENTLDSSYKFLHTFVLACARRWKGVEEPTATVYSRCCSTRPSVKRSEAPGRQPRLHAKCFP